MRHLRTANLKLLRVNRRPTEATIQARLYRLAVNAGFDIELEASVQLPDGRRIRADLAAITRGYYAYALIEVKRTNRQRRNKPSKQAQRYDLTGLPWRYCRGPDDIQETVLWLHSIA